MEPAQSTTPAILLVDDVNANIVALDAVLRPLEVELLSARSGTEALEILSRESNRVATALLDVQMPLMDGFELAERMRGDRRLADIPIIFMTAHDAERAQALRGYEAGGVDYVVKPFDPDEFREKVRAMMRIDLQRRLLRDTADRDLREERERSAYVIERLEQSGVREYRRLANALPAIVWTCDAEGDVDFVSDRFTDQLHVDANLLRTVGWSGVVHPDDVARWLKSRARARASGEDCSMECRLGSVVDGYRLYHLRELPRLDDDGQVTGWVGSGLDIEDQHEALANKLLAEINQVLRDAMEWRTALSTVPRLLVPAFADVVEISLVTPSQETWSTRTPSAEREGDLVGRGRELLGLDTVFETGAHRFLPLVPDPAAAGFHSAMALAIRARGTTYGTLTMLARNSSRRFDLEDLDLGTRLADQIGATVRDGSLFDQARAGADAAMVLDAVGDGVALLDADGTVRVWNAAAERISGIRAAELVGRRAGDVIPWWRDLEPQVPTGTDEKVVAARTLPAQGGGDDLWLSISGVDFGRGRAYAFRDATRFHRLERMQSDFIATVSHELRTPLTSITGACETLTRTDIDLDDTTRDQLFDVIVSQSRRLATLVDDVLVAGRVGATDVKADLHPVDALEVARHVTDAASLQAPDGIDLKLVATDPLPDVMADAHMLEQVLTNLVDNAMKYSPQGGLVEVRLWPRVRTMRFEVADHGIGISEADLPEIFSKFFRVDADMSGGIGGTGLGLYIVRELVERMRGRLDVRSQLGHGTTVAFDLPLARSAVDALTDRPSTDGASSVGG